MASLRVRLFLPTAPGRAAATIRLKESRCPKAMPRTRWPYRTAGFRPCLITLATSAPWRFANIIRRFLRKLLAMRPTGADVPFFFPKPWCSIPRFFALASTLTPRARKGLARILCSHWLVTMAMVFPCLFFFVRLISNSRSPAKVRCNQPQVSCAIWAISDEGPWKARARSSTYLANLIEGDLSIRRSQG